MLGGGVDTATLVAALRACPPPPTKQRNKARTLAHAQTIHYKLEARSSTIQGLTRMRPAHQQKRGGVVKENGRVYNLCLKLMAVGKGLTPPPPCAIPARPSRRACIVPPQPPSLTRHNKFFLCLLVCRIVVAAAAAVGGVRTQWVWCSHNICDLCVSPEVRLFCAGSQSERSLSQLGGSTKRRCAVARSVYVRARVCAGGGGVFSVGVSCVRVTC